MLETAGMGDQAPEMRRAAARGLHAGPIIAVLLGSLSFALLFAWDGLYPLVTVPLVVGVFVGLLAADPRESLLTGVAAGLLGSVAACVFYNYDVYSAYLQKTNPAATTDVMAVWWHEFVAPLIAANPINDALVGPVIVVAASTALVVAFSVGTCMLADKYSRVLNQRWLGLGVIAALGVCLAFTMFVSGSTFIKYISSEPPAKSYGFDAIINLKAYYLVRGGTDYYDAIIKAAEGDLRIKDIKNGKWGRDWGIVSPTHIRQPAVFYLWAVVGYFGASGIVWASLLLVVGLWVVWYWTLFPRLGQRALFVAFALYPLFTVHIGGFNLFHPDWWATMMMMYSAAFLVQRRFTTSSAFSFVAVIFREVLAFYLLVVIAVAVVLWLRKRLAGREVVGFVAALGAFVVAYAAHYFSEAPYIVLKSQTSTIGGVLSFASQPLRVKFLGPTSYLMFPYGDAIVPAFLLAVVGAVGLFLLLRGSDLARFALPAYVAAFLVFLATVGASSSYWGQDISPLAVTGCAVLLAGLDRLGGSPDEREAAPADSHVEADAAEGASA